MAYKLVTEAAKHMQALFPVRRPLGAYATYEKMFLRMLICSENVVLGKGLVPPPHHPQQGV